MRFSYKSVHPSRFICVLVGILLGAIPSSKAANLLGATPYSKSTSHVVLMGAPGSGKGTIARMLRNKLKIPHISSGDLVRAEIEAGTPLGKKAIEFHEKGQLLPDRPEFMGVLFESLKKRLLKEDTKAGFILEDIPRTSWQNQELEKVLTATDKKLDLVVFLDADQEALVSRLAGRLICKSCRVSYHRQLIPPRTPWVCDHCGRRLIQREDDQSKIVQNRLELYAKQIEPVLEYFEKKGRLVRINATGSPEEVCEQVMTSIQNHEIKNSEESSGPSTPGVLKAKL